jgi:hypothetical protein
VAGRSLQQEVFRQTGFRRSRRVAAFHLPDLFDQEAQRYADHGAVQNSSSNGGRQRDFSDLPQQPARECAEGANDAFRQRQDVFWPVIRSSAND